MTIHPTAEVHTKSIGSGTRIWQYCVILDGAVIGRNCNINYNVFIESDVTIGDNVTIKSGVQLWDGLIIEDEAFIGPNVTFTNDLIPRSKVYPAEFKNTLIKEGVSIGANATILMDICIGEYALIGAGSVVTKDVPPFTLWYGNPAKHRGYVTRDGILLDKNLVSKSGQQFIFRGRELVVQW